MEAIPQIGLSLLALLPGLFVYCAVYSVFGSNSNVSMVPRDPRSVEALTVILIGAIAVHGVLALVGALFDYPCAWRLCASVDPIPVADPASALFEMAEAGLSTPRALGILLVQLIGASLVAYAVIRWQMRRLQRQDRLPYWLYRWTAQLANHADKDDRQTLAFVMTDIDVGTKAVLYIGVVADLALDEGFNLSRLVLTQVERYLVDPAASFGQVVRARAHDVATIPLLVIEARTIRNVAFERLDLAGLEIVFEADPALQDGVS